jgi:SSS family solute:Na+ symporter
MKMLYPAMDAAKTFPQFIMLYFPGFPAGVFLAVLLIAIIGCGAGLTLGISSIITSNLESPLALDRNEEKKLAGTRISIIVVLLLAVIFTMGDLQSIILQWSFMSMGLRGAVIFLPMCGALFLPGKVKAGYAVMSIIAGPLCMLAGSVFFKLSFDPLFLGMAVGLSIMIIGYMAGSKN